MIEKRLGKINIARFGDWEGRLGFWFDLGGQGWGVGADFCTWAEWSELCKWTVEEQKGSLGDACLSVRDLLKAAKVSNLDQLVGKPVEVVFDGRMLKSWRILEEVL